MKILKSLKNQATSFLDQYKQKSPATYAAAEQAVGAILITDGLVGIEPPFAGNKRPGIFGTLGGIAFGIVFMFIPTFIGSLSDTNNMTKATTATVTVVEESGDSEDNSCYIKAKYTVNGKEYISSSGMSSPDNCYLSRGEVIDIKYNPDKPLSWSNSTGSINMFLQVFFWAGALTTIGSLFRFVIRLFSIVFGWKLVKEGRELAKTLPSDTNLKTIIDEIKQNFIKYIFNFGNIVTPATEPTKSDKTA